MFWFPEYYLSNKPEKLTINQCSPDALTDKALSDALAYFSDLRKHFDNLLCTDLPNIDHPDLSREKARIVLQDLDYLQENFSANNSSIMVYFLNLFTALHRWYNDNKLALQNIEALLPLNTDSFRQTEFTFRSYPHSPAIAQKIDRIKNALPHPFFNRMIEEALAHFQPKFSTSSGDEEKELFSISMDISYSMRSNTLYLKEDNIHTITEAVAFWLAHECLPNSISHGVNPFSHQNEIFTIADLLTHFLDDRGIFELLYSQSRKPDNYSENTPTRIWMRLFDAFVHYQTRISELQPLNSTSWLDIYQDDPFYHATGHWPAMYWFTWDQKENAPTWNILPIAANHILKAIAQTMMFRINCPSQNESVIAPPKFRDNYLVNRKLWEHALPIST